jgi:hypothetical protein
MGTRIRLDLVRRPSRGGAPASIEQPARRHVKRRQHHPDQADPVIAATLERRTAFLESGQLYP